MCSTWFDTVLGHHQPLRDLLVGMAEGQLPKHLDFARGQPGRPFAPRGRAAARGLQHRLHASPSSRPAAASARSSREARSGSSGARCGRGSVMAW
jgi:hypothetical protein